MAARKAGGDFKNLYDFCQRVDSKQVNKRALEALILSGAFDYMPLPVERSVLFSALSDAVRTAEQQANNQAAGMEDLFSDMLSSDDSEADPYEHHRHVLPWRLKQRLQGEKDTLGLYISGHPYDEYRTEVRPWLSSDLAGIRASKQGQKIGGLIVDIRTMKNRRGENMAFIRLDDNTAQVEVGLFKEVYEEYRPHLEVGQVCLIEASINEDEYRGGLRVAARKLDSLEQARKKYIKQVRLKLENQSISPHLCEDLAKLLSDTDDQGLEVLLHIRTQTCECDVQLGAKWNINPTDEQLANLKQRYGENNLELIKR